MYVCMCACIEINITDIRDPTVYDQIHELGKMHLLCDCSSMLDLVLLNSVYGAPTLDQEHSNRGR